MRRARPITILVVATVGVAMLIASAWVQARLVWNFTPSIPTGLYAIEERAWNRGDRVALKPSGELLLILQTTGVLKEGRLLMKRLAAIEGDCVCRSGRQVTINGAASVIARSDAELPGWSGCVRLAANDVFLLGESDNSFDGRYFGISRAADIVGPIRSIFEL